MFIKSLAFKNNVTKLEIEPVHFEKLTLLVGISGVGKTQILNAIKVIKEISEGKSHNGIEWRIEFTGSNNKTYIWEGAYEALNYSEKDDILKTALSQLLDQNRDTNALISFERLFEDKEIIIERDDKRLFFEGEKTVKLPQGKSALSLLQEEDRIKTILHSLTQITSENYESTRLYNYQQILDKYTNFEELQNSSENLIAKLYFALEKHKEIFNQIKERFIDVFPQVEDVKIEIVKWNTGLSQMNEIPIMFIREKGVDEWISQSNLSSGMRKTLLYISNIYLCAEGTVILIDEFENSLGINCIDEIIDYILSSGRKLQFILTSHHPYIINNINFKNWKVVNRSRSTIKTYNASELNLGNTKHEAFIQLINLDVYNEGIEL